MQVHSVQVVAGSDPRKFQEELFDAIQSCEEDNHEVEIHFAMSDGDFSAVVVGRSRDYWNLPK